MTISDRQQNSVAFGRREASMAVVALVFCLFAVPVLGADAVVPQHRVALVVGNSSYASKTWPELAGGPLRDAESVSAKLRLLGFTVSMHKDVKTKREFADALAAFQREISARPGTLAFFYFAGHGAQALATHGARVDNYLIPTESGLARESEAVTEAVSLTEVRAAIEAAKPAGAVIVLDACRSNDLQRDILEKRIASGDVRFRGLGRLMGLASTGEVPGFLIAFSTSAGNVALNAGNGDLSPFTRALVKELGRTGDPLTPAFMRIRREVLRETLESPTGRQQPEVLVQWSQDFILAPGPREAQLEQSDPLAPVSVPIRVTADNVRTESSWRSPGRAFYFADLRIVAPSAGSRTCSVAVRVHYSGPQGERATVTRELQATFSRGEAAVQQSRFEVPEGSSVQTLSGVRLIGC